MLKWLAGKNKSSDQSHGWRDGRMDGRRDRRIEGWTDGGMDGRMEGWMDGWRDIGKDGLREEIVMRDGGKGPLSFPDSALRVHVIGRIAKCYEL